MDRVLEIVSLSGTRSRKAARGGLPAQKYRTDPFWLLKYGCIWVKSKTI